jgi:dolichol-phosphate mannosyltransferase
MPAQHIAIVIPVHNEAANIPEVFREVARAFSDALPDCTWEILLVDDGSRDGSWQAIAELARADSRVRGISLSRNFGKEMALTAGLESAGAADAVLCLDADLQHPPSLIPEFVARWRQGAEVVVGIRQKCEDYTLVKRLGSRCFYSIMRRFSDISLQPNSTDFRLMDRKVVENLLRFTERSRMFRGLVDWMGFQRETVEFCAPARANDARPSYSIKKLYALAINSFTSFSLLPLRFTGYVGLVVTAGAGLLLLFMLVTDFLRLNVYTPQAYFLVFNTLLTGITLCALGMIALYIGHIHTEVVGRPPYIISKRTPSATPTSPPSAD